MSRWNKKKKDTELKRLPLKRQLLIPEKSEANFPMTLTPVANKDATIAKFNVIHTEHGYVVEKHNQNLAFMKRMYTGKPRHRDFLRVGPRTFKFRMLTDSSFRNMILSNHYVYVQGLLVLAPIAYEIIKRKISIYALLNNDLFHNIIRDCIMQETRKEEKESVVTETAVKHYTVNAHGGVAARTKNGNILYNNRATTDSIDYAINYKAIPAPRDIDYNEHSLQQLSNQLSKLFVKFGGKNTRKPPEDFRELFASIIGEHDFLELEELTGISARTIERIKNEKEHRPQLRQLVAICIAVKAMPTDTVELIRLAGLQFRDTYEEQVYLAIVNTCHMFGVKYCNNLLEHLGVTPLTDLGLENKKKKKKKKK